MVGLLVGELGRELAVVVLRTLLVLKQLLHLDVLVALQLALQVLHCQLLLGRLLLPKLLVLLLR